MPSDETRRLLKVFGVAVTNLEDAIDQHAPVEQITKLTGTIKNNLPVDLMRTRSVGSVIGIDVSPASDLALAVEPHAELSGSGLRRRHLAHGQHLARLAKALEDDGFHRRSRLECGTGSSSLFTAATAVQLNGRGRAGGTGVFAAIVSSHALFDALLPRHLDKTARNTDFFPISH